MTNCQNLLINMILTSGQTGFDEEIGIIETSGAVHTSRPILTSMQLRQPSLGTKAVIFFPFLISCTLTHFLMAELGCLASTPLKQQQFTSHLPIVFCILGYKVAASIKASTFILKYQFLAIFYREKKVGQEANRLKQRSVPISGP